MPRVRLRAEVATEHGVDRALGKTLAARFDRLQSEASDTGRTEPTRRLAAPRHCLELFRAPPISICGAKAWNGPVEIGFDGYAIGGLSVGEEKVGDVEVVDDMLRRCRQISRAI